MKSECPSTSRLPLDEASHDSIPSEESKELLKETVVHYENLLLENDIKVEETPTDISSRAVLIEDKKILVEDHEWILPYEDDADKLYETVSENEEPNSDDEEYEPLEKERKVEHIPLKIKMKVVKLAELHPNWKLSSLQSKGSKLLKSKDQLLRWKKDVKGGGTKYDKYAAIEGWTYDRFKEAREKLIQVTTRNLQEWATAAASQFRFQDFNFKASLTWTKDFTRKYNIRQRQITKFISHKEHSTMTEVLEAAKT